MNYHLFNRASGAVVISDNGEQLFLKETVKGNVVENSYYPVPEEEIQHIVTTINEIYAHYKADGFDEVYFSFLPNPATILQPQGYNQLIPRIEHHPGLQAPLISMYQPFLKAGKRIFRPGDTHWNNEGLQIWLSAVNKVLVQHNETH